jgi:DNA repair protein RadC
LIIAHNHLSSIPEPSSEDVEMTAILENAAELMKIDLWDHIIVTTDGYYSFNEAGRIKVKKY